MGTYEKQPSELDKILSNEEINLFADEVIWPAIDHIYGSNFRATAQKKPRSRISRKIREVENDSFTERIIIQAESNPNHFVVDDDSGERLRVCDAQISIDTMMPDLKEGALKVLEADWGENEDGETDWWVNDEGSWEVWEGKTFHFSTDVSNPLSIYFSFEAQDCEERSPSERFLWNYEDEDDFNREGFPEKISVEGLSKQLQRKANRTMRRTKKVISEREDEFLRMITWRDCLELRGALIRFGVPADVLKVAK